MPDPDEAALRVAIIEEAITVAKTTIKTDAVRVITSVEEREVVVEELLTREALSVKRYPVERQVDVAPLPREDGNTTIISIVEERAVVLKQLFVVEEVHVTREQTQEPVAIPVTLRSTRASVERPVGNEATGNETND